MTPDFKTNGRTEIASINMLNPVEVDFAAGISVPPNLGETEAPVNILPTVELDLLEATAAPVLVLTLKLRPDATPAGAAVDLFMVWKALNAYEVRLNGAGLNPGEASDERTADGTVIRLVLSATEPLGATERLAKLTEVVNGAMDAAIPNDLLTGRSFEGCGAELRTAA